MPKILTWTLTLEADVIDATEKVHRVMISKKYSHAILESLRRGTPGDQLLAETQVMYNEIKEAIE